jgi:hypothetical protein
MHGPRVTRYALKEVLIRTVITRREEEIRLWLKREQVNGFTLFIMRSRRFARPPDPYTAVSSKQGYHCAGEATGVAVRRPVSVCGFPYTQWKPI